MEEEDEDLTEEGGCKSFEDGSNEVEGCKRLGGGKFEWQGCETEGQPEGSYGFGVVEAVGTGLGR